MFEQKRTLIKAIYFVIIFVIIYINATILIEWFNRSLYVDFSNDFGNTKESFDKGITFFAIIITLIYAMIGTFLVSLLISNLLFGAFIIANNIKMIERNEFITFSELQTVLAPKELLSFVDVSVGFAILILILGLLGLVGLQMLILSIYRRLNFKINIKIRFAIITICFMGLLVIFIKPNAYNIQILKFEDTKSHNFNPVTRARKDGLLSSFIHTIQPTYMEKPTAYTKDRAEDIKQKYVKLAGDINEERNADVSDSQTIIYLSETLMDPLTIPNLITNETPIPYISQLRDEHIGGSMYSQYIGGGTANIEWSLLTSFSLDAFRSPLAVTPYSDFYLQSKNHQTILSMFDEKKVALHPYSPHLYKRRSVYRTVGFDDFLYLDNGIQHTEKLGTQVRVSDEALNKDILREAEDDSVDFMHVLTMQNHSPFNGEIPEMEYEPEINLDVFPEDNEDGLFNYLQGLKASDEATKELIEQLEKSDREVNVIFFGDHYPSLFRGLEEEFDELLTETPWFLYMNNDRSKTGKKYNDISPLFFVPILLKEGDYYVSPFYALLDELLDNGVQRIGTDFVVTEEGMIKDEDLSEDLLELLEDYRIIQYDSLFGSHWLGDDFFIEND